MKEISLMMELVKIKQELLMFLKMNNNRYAIKN